MRLISLCTIPRTREDLEASPPGDALRALPASKLQGPRSRATTSAQAGAHKGGMSRVASVDSIELTAHAAPQAAISAQPPSRFAHFPRSVGEALNELDSHETIRSEHASKLRRVASDRRSSEAVRLQAEGALERLRSEPLDKHPTLLRLRTAMSKYKYYPSITNRAVDEGAARLKASASESPSKN